MKVVLYLALFASAVYCVQGLTCWICENVATNDDCISRGRAQICQVNERACHTSVRRGSFGMLITKRCKQAHACDNNFIQNPRAAWSPSQCNTRTPSSVCRCCCDTDLCNRNSLDCQSDENDPRGPRDQQCAPIAAPRNGRKVCTFGGNVIHENDEADLETECRFTCNEGYRLVGDDVRTCDLNPETQEAEFNRQTPTCTSNTCFISQAAPSNGNVDCTNDNNFGSICAFNCDNGYELIGDPAVTCQTSRQWTADPPTCRQIVCNPRHTDPRNGLVTCDDDNNLDSTCRFECNPGFFLEGIPQSICTLNSFPFSGADWSSEAPVCSPIICLPQSVPVNGDVSCNDGVNLNSICTFTCNEGYFLNGSPNAQCFDDGNDDEFGEWTNPPPICQPVICIPQSTPLNGAQSCTDDVNLGSVCSFTCNNGYFLEGSDSATCIDDGDNDADGVWTNPPPDCGPLRCIRQVAPENGEVECSNDNNLNSLCSFACNEGYLLDGPATTRCVDVDGTNRNASWNRPRPTCQLIECPVLSAPPNGRVSCSSDNLLESVCSFSCDESRNFTLFPQEQRDLTCQSDSSWTSDPPCCALPCPPFAVMDLVLVLDSSSSIGRQNWAIMKSVIRQFIELFDYSSNFTRLAVFRYNARVDSRSQILLNSFPNDRAGLLRAFDAIPYDGSGTRTGQAVAYVRNQILLPSRGDRPDAQNVVIVITDGRAQDGTELGIASRNLRRDGVLTYAVGIEPPRGSLDEDQLLEIGGEQSHVLIAEGGFTDLGPLLERELSEEVCENRCS